MKHFSLSIQLLAFIFIILWLPACHQQKSYTDEQSSSKTVALNKDFEKAYQGDRTTAALDEKYKDLDKAIFAGGCFWCIEAVFERVNGVVDVLSGYTGGPEKLPLYKEVSYGKTGHVESVVIYFDSDIISYEKLLEVFFAVHKPTQVNGQGPDIGAQYRTEIFYLDKDQQQAANAYIDELNNSGQYDKPIATQVTKADTFWLAEDYHQDFYEHNPNQGYIVQWARPKVAKLKNKFPELIKEKYRS